jgi:tetratricopeptide (TPR) repeat protein
MMGDYMDTKQLLANIMRNLENNEDSEKDIEEQFHELAESMQKDGTDRKSLEPEIGIVQSTLLMNKGSFCEALDTLHASMQVTPDNYELYYFAALCYECMDQIEDAYFYYRFAIMLSADTKDQKAIIKDFRALCKRGIVNEYRLGKACENLVKERLEFHEYDSTQKFLSRILYDTNKIAAKAVLSEENMLLFIMLEITLCEEKMRGAEESEETNTCILYHNNVLEFKEVYCKLKLMIRRIWFGFPIEKQREIYEVLDYYPVSPQMLAVITKYSVREEVWIDVFDHLCVVLASKDSNMYEMLMQYSAWLSFVHRGKTEQCVQQYSLDNGLKIKLLDYLHPVQPITKEKDPNKISFILCVNDSLYCNECIEYLKRLELPEGMHAEVLAVTNATGMAAGYNQAMNYSNATYKVYLHQDTFIIYKDAIIRMINEFRADESIGMMGIAGCINLDPEGYWWKGDAKNKRMCIYQDAVLNILRSLSVVKHTGVEEAEAIDGIFIGTSKDVMWQQEVFDHWHYYDISQCFEFAKCHYKVCLINDDHIWVLHETTMRKDKEKNYEKYKDIFTKKYLTLPDELETSNEHINV